MASDGKQLEDLVAFVERTLAPHGLKVTTNERLFNDEGVQIAEFDVEVSGRFGSTEISWLIECRDRPGSGPAPSYWIEQLVGRRARFGFNKVTAVSTTGFAPGAVDFAKNQKIELREVASLSPEAFLPWLALRSVQQYIQNAHLLHAKVLLDASEPEDRIRAVESLVVNASHDDPILRSTKTGDRGSLVQAFLSAIHNVGNLFDDVVANSSPKPVELHVNYDSDDDHFAIDTAAGAVRVRLISYSGELNVKFTAVPIIEVAEYRRLDSEGPISQVVSFAAQELLGIKTSMEFHRIAETGEIHLLLRKARDGE